MKEIFRWMLKISYWGMTGGCYWELLTNTIKIKIAFIFNRQVLKVFSYKSRSNTLPVSFPWTFIFVFFFFSPPTIIGLVDLKRFLSLACFYFIFLFPPFCSRQTWHITYVGCHLEGPLTLGAFSKVDLRSLCWLIFPDHRYCGR